MDVDLEPFRLHLSIDSSTSIGFAKRYPRRMTLKRFLDDILDGRRCGIGTGVGSLEIRVVVWKESTGDLVLENVDAVRDDCGVILDCLKHEPDGVSGVISRLSTAQKIGDHAMLHDAGEGKDVLSSFSKEIETVLEE